MNTNKYYLYGMYIFEQMVKNGTALEINRSSISAFLDRLAGGHKNVIEKYGFEKILSSIFVREVSRFLSVSLGIPEFTEKEYPLTVDEDNAPDLNGCAIIYPCFVYKHQNHAALAHIPTIRGFMINGESIEEISIDYETYENDSTLSAESVIHIATALAVKICEIWRGEHDLSAHEEEEMKNEILALLVLENSRACKDNVVNYLSSEAGMPDLSRILNKANT